MVQITEARTFNPITKAWGPNLPADGSAGYDPAVHGKLEKEGSLECVCPDTKCTSRLSRYDEYHQTFHDVDTGEPYRLKIPARYQRKKGSDPHHPDCEIAKEYGEYQSYVRKNGGLSTGDGAFYFNLNIDCGDQPAPIRDRKLTSQKGFFKVSGYKNSGGTSSRKKRSEGVGSIEVLAKMIEKSVFDPRYRKSAIFRRAGYHGRATRIYTLDELYYEDPIDFFRTIHRAMKENRRPSAAVLFKPIKILKFWNRNKDGTGVIFGQAIPIMDEDGNRYYVNMALRVRSKALFDHMKVKVFKKGESSFLVYSENIRLDLMAFAHKKMDIQNGIANDHGVHTDIYVSSANQIMPWVPPRNQKTIDLKLNTSRRILEQHLA